MHKNCFLSSVQLGISARTHARVRAQYATVNTKMISQQMCVKKTIS